MKIRKITKMKSGKYKILALAKSYYKKVNYEDYSELTFVVKE